MTLEIANKLIELRKARGVSQEELAAHLGISRQAISKWERGEASPDIDNIVMLSRFYGVSRRVKSHARSGRGGPLRLRPRDRVLGKGERYHVRRGGGRGLRRA